MLYKKFITDEKNSDSSLNSLNVVTRSTNACAVSKNDVAPVPVCFFTMVIPVGKVLPDRCCQGCC